MVLVKATGWLTGPQQEDCNLTLALRLDSVGADLRTDLNILRMADFDMKITTQAP